MLNTIPAFASIKSFILPRFSERTVYFLLKLPSCRSFHSRIAQAKENVAFKAENLVEAASDAFELMLEKHSSRINREPSNFLFHIPFYLFIKFVFQVIRLILITISLKCFSLRISFNRNDSTSVATKINNIRGPRRVPL